MQDCALDLACKMIFTAKESTGYVCVKDTTIFSETKLTNDTLVQVGKAYNKGTTSTTKKRAPVDLFDKRSFIAVIKDKMAQAKA